MDKSKIETILEALLDEMLKDECTSEINIGKYRIRAKNDEVTTERCESKEEKPEQRYQTPANDRPPRVEEQTTKRSSSVSRYDAEPIYGWFDPVAEACKIAGLGIIKWHMIVCVGVLEKGEMIPCRAEGLTLKILIQDK